MKFSRAAEFLLNRTLNSGSILKLPNRRATGINQGSKISGRNPIHSVEKMKENQTGIIKKLLKKYKPEIREITDS